MEWQDIKTAPKDGTLIDLWCVPLPDSDFVPENGGIRLTDCGWHDADSVVCDITGWCRVLDDGDWDFVEDDATNALGLPKWKPTHWMPLPEPPKQ